MAHRLFIDINVILDVAAERDPHKSSSQKILSEIEGRKARGFMSPASYPTLYYLLKKEIGPDDAREFLAVLAKLLSVVAIDKTILGKALMIHTEDYEDAIQVACAQACGAHFIITRDASGYKDTPIKALTPSEYLATYR